MVNVFFFIISDVGGKQEGIVRLASMEIDIVDVLRKQ